MLFFTLIRGDIVMIITIRELQDTQHEYIAYTKSLCGKATYFVCFEDSIWGAVNLHSFIEMLKIYFKQEKVELKLSDKTLAVKNKDILSLFQNKQDNYLD
jgi:hypothetical protein